MTRGYISHMTSRADDVFVGTLLSGEGRLVVGVPVATVQETTIRGSTGNTVEGNEGLHPHIRWTKTPDFIHAYRGILPMNRVFFLTSVVCPVRSTQAGRASQ